MRTSASFLVILLGVSVHRIHCQDDTSAADSGQQGTIGRMVGALLTYFTVGDFEELLSSAVGLDEDQGDGNDKEDGKGKDSTSDNDEGDSLSVIQNLAILADNVHFLTCTTETTCFNDSTQTPGAWTCRPQLVGKLSLCIPTILGVTMGREDDSCGCCDGVCPVRCECSCTTARGTAGVLTRFNLMFGLLDFEECLDPTVSDSVTSFTTLNIACSDSCKTQEQEEVEQVNVTVAENAVVDP
jgi:hypothetical protein